MLREFGIDALVMMMLMVMMMVTVVCFRVVLSDSSRSVWKIGSRFRDLTPAGLHELQLKHYQSQLI